MTTTTAEPTTRTFDAPGATITYDVRESDAATYPPLVIIGSPMGASGFVTLAGHFADRTVVTYDPRGADRSPRTDDAMKTVTEEHADDLHRLIDAVGGGPVDIFGSSGGAINALALVASHPEQVRTVVAHEPPAAGALVDRETAIAAAQAVHDTYVSDGFGPAMAKFITFVSHQGPVPEGFLIGPGPDPSMFGLPSQDDGSRKDPLVGLNMPTTPSFAPDVEALRAASTRVVLGVGEESGETLAARAARAIADQLGTEAIVFPGGHDGFLGGEYGSTGKPTEFAAKLREVLDSRH
jgi:pimeloyl-ACP methyl ester carboxylesterase